MSPVSAFCYRSKAVGVVASEILQNTEFCGFTNKYNSFGVLTATPHHSSLSLIMFLKQCFVPYIISDSSNRENLIES